MPLFSNSAVTVMGTCIYTRGSRQSRIILGIHANDQAIIGPNKYVIDQFKSELSEEFKMKDLGSLTHILGVEVKRDRKDEVMTLYKGATWDRYWNAMGCKIVTPLSFFLPLVSRLTKMMNPLNPWIHKSLLSLEER